MQLRPHLHRIVETIARIARNAGGAYPDRNPAPRVDEQEPAFVGRIVANKDRLATGKRRVCKQGGDAFSFIVAGLLKFGDHLALLHGKTGALRHCAKKFQDLIA